MQIHKQSLTTILLVVFAIISTVKADITLSNTMQLSTQQLLMESVQSLLPTEYKDKDINSVKLMSVTKKNSLTKVENLCNIIRAPNHQPYRLIKKLKHQIKNDTDWYKLVLQQFVIFKLQDINYLHYALDMEVVGKNLVLAFPNGELIFYEETQVNVIKEVSRKIACQTNQYLKFGKIAVADDVGIFISNNCIALINSTGQTVTKIGGFDKPKAFFTAIIEKDNSNIDLLVAEGRDGIKHYLLNQGATQFTKLGSHSITSNGNKVVVTDFIEITKLVDHAVGQRVLLILDPQLGIVKVTLPKRGGQQIFEGQLTNMTNKNCRMLKQADEKIFTSCPQVVSFNPKTNEVVGNPILSQLPIEFIPGYHALTIISHNSFQNIDKCSGSTQEGWFEGDSFHHTVRFGNNFVSVDEVSLIVWNIKLPSYFIACRGNQKLVGKYLIKFGVYSICLNQATGMEQCCTQIYQQQVNVYDSAKGYHMLEIVGVVLLLACSTTATLCILYKRRKITQQYNELLEENHDKIKNNNLSMVEDKGEKKEINVTEQNIVSANGRKSNFQELQQ